jgi:hypothetical protein
MRWGQRMLAALCRGTVVVWIAAYLAWGVVGTATEPVRSDLHVTVEPRPQPPAVAATAPIAEPSPVAVTEAALREGIALLERAGSFPALSCSYDQFPSFLSYARAMQGLGARFVVVRQRHIVGEWDLASRTFRERAPEGSFSPRARDYTEEPALRQVAQVAREHFGPDAVVMMVVPQSIDAGLFGGIAHALAQRGDPHDGYRELLGRYERGEDGALRIRLESGRREDGTTVPLDLVFDLGAIASLADRTPAAS